MQRVYSYTRVVPMRTSTKEALEVQRRGIINYAKTHGFEIIREYSDVGYAGGNGEMLPEFSKMMNDIANKKEDISFVLVHNLSRISKHPEIVVTALHRMQRNGVNLIGMQDEFDSTTNSARLLIWGYLKRK